MELEAIEGKIEEAIADAEARVSRPRSHDENEEDDHFAALVVSPAFEGLSLVEQHQLVYDALDDWMTEEIHALEIKTYTPEEYEEFVGDR